MNSIHDCCTLRQQHHNTLVKNCQQFELLQCQPTLCTDGQTNGRIDGWMDEQTDILVYKHKTHTIFHEMHRPIILIVSFDSSHQFSPPSSSAVATSVLLLSCSVAQLLTQYSKWTSGDQWWPMMQSGRLTRSDGKWC